MGRQMSTWEARARVLLGDPGTPLIAVEALEDHVRMAIRVFSRDRPRVLSQDFPGNGSSYDLAISSLTGWDHASSYIEAVEYPSGEREPVYLDEAEVVPYPSTSQPTAIRLLVTTPATGQTARVFYTAPWPVPTSDADVDQIGETDYEPVVALGAAYGALQLGARAAGVTSPSLPLADAVDWSSEDSRWREIYRELRKIYLDHVGAGESGADAPASVTTDWDARSTWVETGRRFLFRDARR